MILKFGREKEEQSKIRKRMQALFFFLDLKKERMALLFYIDSYFS